MPLPLAALAIPAAAKAIYGIYQSSQANKALRNLPDMPEYEITPEQKNSYARAERMARTGYTPQESASFYQRLAQVNRTALQRGLTIGGGGVSQALNAAVLASNIGANLDFAANDAALKRRNIQYADSLGQGITGQRNRNTAQRIAYLTMLNQQYGAAKQQGRMNTLEAVGSLPYMFMQNEYLNNLNPNTIDMEAEVTDIPAGANMMSPSTKGLPQPQQGKWNVNMAPAGFPFKRTSPYSPVERRF